MNSDLDSNYIEYTILNFENKYAILHNSVFGTINWPIKKLPDDVKIGDKHYIGIVQPTDSQIYTQEKQVLHSLLQELIK